MAKKRPTKRRGRRTRARTGQGAKDQFEQIHEAQRLVRRGKIIAVIDDVSKSQQRFQNILNSIRDSSDSHEEFD
jgi:DNA anti-recombination protein RmuC